ncbi:MAG: protein TonB [Lentimonas sp.]|jgi:protein TonB
MKISKNQSLWASAILHVALLVCLFLTTIVEAFLPREKPHVFEMISEPSPQQPSTLSDAAPMETPSDLEIADIKPLDIPDPVMPEPAPVKPRPAPMPVKPRPEPTPAKVTPKLEPLISLDDFREKNPLKTPKPRKPTPPQPTYKAPTINTSRINTQLQDNLPTTVYNPSGSLTVAERTALQRYGDQLNRRLNGAWIKPSNLAGVGLTVTVVFDVSSSGRITNIRLRPASGNGSFDASVKAAFSRVGSGGVTPTGQGHRFTMSFKMGN